MYIRICVYVLKRFSMLLRFDKKKSAKSVETMCERVKTHFIIFFTSVHALVCLVGWFVHLAGWLYWWVGWSVGWLVWLGWLVGWLVGVGWLDCCLLVCLVDRLLASWLIDRLIGWMWCGWFDPLCICSKSSSRGNQVDGLPRASTFQFCLVNMTLRADTGSEQVFNEFLDLIFSNVEARGKPSTCYRARNS